MLKRMLLVVVLFMVMVSSGCQMDIQGPSVTTKLLYKGENGNKEFLSRGSGMAGGNAYSAGGLSSVGDGGCIWSWGGASEKEE